jgi:hypothetical protein
MDFRQHLRRNRYCNQHSHYFYPVLNCGLFSDTSSSAIGAVCYTKWWRDAHNRRMHLLRCAVCRSQLTHLRSSVRRWSNVWETHRRENTRISFLTRRAPQLPINGISLTRPAGVKRFLALFCLFTFFFFSIRHTSTRSRRSAVLLYRSFDRRRSLFTLRVQARVTSSFRCCPPSISPIMTDHDE